MKKNKKKDNPLDYITIPKIDLEPGVKRDIFAIALVLFGIVAILGLFDMAGLFGEYVVKALVAVFGWGKWMFPVILFGLSFWLYNKEKYNVRGLNYFGLVIFLLSFQTLLQLFVSVEEWDLALKAGQGGGYLGWFMAMISIKAMGFWASLLAVFSLILISCILMFNTSLARLVGLGSWPARLLLHPIKYFFNLFRANKEAADANEDEEYEEEETTEEEPVEEAEDVMEAELENADNAEIGFLTKPVQALPNFLHKKTKPVKKEKEQTIEQTHINIDLPLDLLNPKIGKPTSGDIKANTATIKSTLEKFGIPVEMGDVSVGPTVTQYTLKPAEGIKLSRITDLNNNLSMALAAHPIRIEAPIPGKSLVGIEVPNKAIAVVGLKEILNSSTFEQREVKTLVALGKDVAGQACLTNICKMPHVLVAGATGSGKSVMLNSLIVSLLYQNNPDDLRLIMVDPKRVELSIYNGIPHLLTPVITEVGKTINALKWCLNEMDRRYETLAGVKKRNIDDYNKVAKEKMPYIVFIIDELADLMIVAAKDIETGIVRLAQMARAVGIHLVLATQRPSVNVITGTIKANMPARIAFAVTSGIDSRTILDSLGAEKLLGRGDMLFSDTSSPKPRRIQGAYISDTEIKKIVDYIKEHGGEPQYVEEVVERQKVSGAAGTGLNSDGDDNDELLEEAKEIIINAGKASTSLLQRRLRIGYARAASLIDYLEEAGVVGPANGAKPREVLVTREQYEQMINQGVSGVTLHNPDEFEPPESYLGELETAEEIEAELNEEIEDEDSADLNNDGVLTPEEIAQEAAEIEEAEIIEDESEVEEDETGSEENSKNNKKKVNPLDNDFGRYFSR